MQDHPLLARDQVPVSREGGPEISFEVNGQATNLAVRICEHPELRSRLVIRACGKYQIPTVRCPECLIDGAPTRNPQPAFCSAHHVDSQEITLFLSGGDHQSRTVRRPA